MKADLGWRCTWKRGSPEDFHKQEATVRRILQRKQKAMQGVREVLKPDAKRHRPIRVDTSKVKAARATQRAAALRERRPAAKRARKRSAV